MGIDRDVGLRSLEAMIRIRAVEEAICSWYPERNIRGAVHLSIGQEAAAVGVLSTCRPDDQVVSTHRNHAHYLAKGGSVPAMVDELFGLPSGCSGGYGGSMHLTAPEVGFIGASAVLPGSMPIAVGLAFAAKYLPGDAIAVAFTGDGAADEGAYYESLNLAAVLSVPVLFVCENNHISTNTVLTDRQAQPDAAMKAAAFGLKTADVDGRNIFDVYDVSRALIERMRSDRQPALLQVDVARLCAHVGPVSPVAPIDADSLIAQARSGTVGDDPISNCLALLVAEGDDVEADCRSILEELPELVRAEFRRASSAFDAYNESRQLVAPPPAKSFAV